MRVVDDRRRRGGRLPAVGSAACAVALCAAGAGGLDVDERHLWEQVAPLLATGAGRARAGDLHGAWTSMRGAFVLGGASELVGLRRAAYCRREGCPRMHDLARLLGKPRTALDFLAGACPDMTEHRCRQWAASLQDGRAYLGDEAAGAAQAQELELRLFFAEEGDPRPWTVVEVGDEAVWAMVDTGGYRVYLAESGVGRPRADFERVGDSYVVVDSDGEVRRRADGVLRGFRVGTLGLERAAAQMVPDQVGVAFGMNVLLRYPAVCFAWPEPRSGAGTLHLGTLGPCRGAQVADRSFLSARTGQPHLEVAMADGTRLPALVDTGAIDTQCKDDVLAGRGDGRARFGAHPALSTRSCRGNPYPIPPSYAFPVMVGMDSLLQFKAFGWELDPFRMYFLPRAR